MASGRCLNYQKNATLANFDGSSGAKTLWIKPGAAVAGIQASIAPNLAASDDARISARIALQVFTGATPSGTGWTGGSWSTVWSRVLTANAGGTTAAVGLIRFDAGFISVEFDPPMEFPSTFRDSVKTIETHAAKGGLVPANTHNAAEVAGEWDIRLFWTSLVATSTSVFDCDANVQMLTREAQ